MTYNELVKHYGTCADAARDLSLPRQTVHQWKKKGIPFEQQWRIQLQTNGRLKAEFPRQIKRNGHGVRASK